MALSASLAMSDSVTPFGAEAGGQAEARPQRAQGLAARAGLRVEHEADALELFVHDLLVEVDHGGQAERVGQAVVQPLLARQRVGERVARAQSLLERDGAHHRGLHHAAARRQVVAVGDGADQVLGAQLEAPQRDGVGHGVIAQRAVRLEAVGERVEPRGRRDAGGHRARELGIEQRRAGEQVRAEDDRLATRRGQRHHARATDLAAGAGGGGDGDDGRDVRADEAIAARGVVVVDQGAIVGDLERDELGRVERRAAPDRDDAPRLVRHVRLVRRDAVEHVLLDGVRVDLGEDLRGHAGLLEQRADALGDAHLDDARVAHDERALRADRLTGRPRRAGARSEDDGGREGPGHEAFAHARRA